MVALPRRRLGKALPHSSKARLLVMTVAARSWRSETSSWKSSSWGGPSTIAAAQGGPGEPVVQRARQRPEDHEPVEGAHYAVQQLRQPGRGGETRIHHAAVAQDQHEDVELAALPSDPERPTLTPVCSGWPSTIGS